MRHKNNGQGEDSILQNQFTNYLMTAVRWRKVSYLKKCARLGKHEFATDFDNAPAQIFELMVENSAALEQAVLDRLALIQALSRISKRERDVFLARALEEADFSDLAAELGIGYKGVAAVYYRAIQKLKKEL